MSISLITSSFLRCLLLINERPALKYFIVAELPLITDRVRPSVCLFPF